MNATAEKFLVVINPNESNHKALERAVISAGIRDLKPSMHLYINPQNMADAEGKCSFGNLDLKALTSILEQHALSYEFEFSWSPDVEKSVVHTARDEEANLIIYPLSDAIYNKHKGLTNGTWTLLRNSTCPVMLVTPESTMQRKVLLAAVNYQSFLPEYTRLNNSIVNRAIWLAEKYEAKLYIVNAYNSMEDYPDFEMIRKITGLPLDNIIVERGNPEKVVTAAALNVNADLVMIGTRNSLDDSNFRRNTAEKVLMKLNRDMIVVN